MESTKTPTPIADNTHKLQHTVNYFMTIYDYKRSQIEKLTNETGYYGRFAQNFYITTHKAILRSFCFLVFFGWLGFFFCVGVCLVSEVFFAFFFFFPPKIT